jgi:NitT/TauT family transport system ATP-binding protein
MAPQMNTVLELKAVGKRFVKDDRAIVALDGLDLTIAEGTFVTLLGRSGCGKSTILNMVAGLSPPTSGEIRYRGEAVTSPLRELGYLTQRDTLMPWRDLRRNVEMPLEIRGVERSRRRRRAEELLSGVSLTGFERHYPHELSGGMLRRACLARMLIGEPETLLLDEPFGALDAQLRGELQVELLRLWTGTGRTVVFVTHDLEEAILLGDRVVVLGRGGRVVLDERIRLPRPRDAEKVRLEPEFLAIHRRLSTALRAHDASAEEGQG